MLEFTGNYDRISDGLNEVGASNKPNQIACEVSTSIMADASLSYKHYKFRLYPAKGSVLIWLGLLACLVIILARLENGTVRVMDQAEPSPSLSAKYVFIVDDTPTIEPYRPFINQRKNLFGDYDIDGNRLFQFALRSYDASTGNLSIASKRGHWIRHWNWPKICISPHVNTISRGIACIMENHFHRRPLSDNKRIDMGRLDDDIRCFAIPHGLSSNGALLIDSQPLASSEKGVSSSSEKGQQTGSNKPFGFSWHIPKAFCLLIFAVSACCCRRGFIQIVFGSRNRDFVIGFCLFAVCVGLLWSGMAILVFN